MEDDPIAAAIRRIPHDSLSIEGGVTKTDGANVHGSLERDFGKSSFGIEGGIAQKTGWGFMGFFKRVWGGK